MSKKFSLATTFVHAGRKKRYTHGSVNPVVQRASSLVFDSLADKKHATINRAKGELFYGRRGTLTHFALQDAMCELEGGAGCYLYPCGAAAVTNSILSFVQTGDHILMTGAAYEPTQDFCNIVLKKLGVTTTFYDPLMGGQIAQLIRPNTKVLFLEAPSSLTMEVADIPAMVKAVRQVNPEIVIMMDNTWSGGVLFKALEHDIDISIQAGTKYLVGHSDIMIGTAVSNARCWNQLREHSYLMGQMADADSAYITARGLRTLGIRLKQHEESSIKIAQWLTQQPEVKAVYHPALPSCPGHEFFKRDFLGASGLFSFELKQKLTQQQLEIFMNHFQLFTMAYSWGGFESLILYNQPEEIAKIRPNIQRKLEGTLIRLHIGLENVDDLIADLSAGFMRLK
ncbi:cystathionine beta-lyase [Aggregatibacter actinomycetemcomitans]|uniref:cystathionine beta-lyase n=1 Tax=Aggregatibacter actinomycetemcomitans TaxID=714 RepID=UPI00022ABEBB|nr:cystathionine beta-lyase [Aggregatibacter actinomycetemcomitans]KOE65035.1 cystathionine beta-lyase [Aggregatibacter actinomycetemcomitans serotype e str. A160]KOE68900.1 cystathionine beta-lyase [Aggregatibacter actinomycetemcomitans serotype e str. SCC393]KOE69445.1 cystathionine beta-lyase [Aggregatibacter actinomycetemcomitans serotype f str. D18P1]KYK75601.1 cystathionine beta-lyase [Aggregatibacter actinomycetemcomitans serotype e str. SA2876]KYK86277.1 cystathionine beta-lyase [Aggre